MTESNMVGPTKLLKTQGVRKLGNRKPIITIGEEDKAPGTWAGRRLLRVNNVDTFELSFWCGTCPFLFERLDQASEQTLSIPDLQATLNEGLSEINDTVIDTFSALLPKGKYLPMLLEIEPKLINPGQPGDYFSEEQHTAWGSYEELGMPENPQTPYYRADTRELDGHDRFFEFVVPMVPPSWNDRDRVEAHVEGLRADTQPTCIAISILDVRKRDVSDTPEQGQVHWGLAHFLLDGHHKIEAAARSGTRLQILSLLSVDKSLAEPDQIKRLPTIFETTR